MKALFRWMCAASLLTMAVAQDKPAPARFEVADVHPSTGLRLRPPSAVGGRYEIHSATMLDLIRMAYYGPPDKFYGGPSWLEWDRYDVIAKMPPGATVRTCNIFLQQLLADRFKLVVHNDTKPIPVYALTAGKHAGLKDADPAGTEGCASKYLPDPPDGPRNFGPLEFTCHKMSMETLATRITGMGGVAPYLNGMHVVDRTGLTGEWDFSFHVTRPSIGRVAGVEIITVFDAMEKQLGLKLQASTAAAPVLVVDSVNRKPTPNSPEALKNLPERPSEFEVAELKPSVPGTEALPNFPPEGLPRSAPRNRAAGPPPQPLQNGRLNLVGASLRQLLIVAWNLNPDSPVEGPKFIDSDHYDVIAKIQSDGGASEEFTSPDVIRPMLRTLLVERFKIAAHMDERPGTAYVLTAAKPKLKPADPAARSKCASDVTPQGAAASLRQYACTNMTMGHFAETLPLIGGLGNAPVIDETKLDGAFDFDFGYSLAVITLAGRGGGDAASPVASDPTGGINLTDAISKLGLKLEQQKRPVPALVIDHVEPKPVEK